MTGHFFCVGIPEELEFKSYGQEGKQLAKWKFGFYRFQTFSETSMEALRTTSGLVMCSGEYRERDYNGETYTDAHVTAVTHWKAAKPKASAKPQPQPEQHDDGCPF